MRTRYRTSDAAFSEYEAWEIRRQLQDPQKLLACPRCGERLSSDLPLPGAEGVSAVYLLRCADCRRYVMFEDLGPRAAPHRRRTL